MSSNNMAVQSVQIGGNVVQPTPDGKIKVTSKTGKIKVLSQDQFVKQIKKNEENLKAGKDFEFKKGTSLLKIGGYIAAAAAIVAGVVYRKNIAKWISSFKKDGPAGITKEFRKSKADSLAETFKDYDGDKVVEGLKNGKKPKDLGLISSSTIRRTDYTGEDFIHLKDVPNLPLTPRQQVLKNNGLSNELQYEAMKAYSELPEGVNKLPGMKNGLIPNWARDKDTCRRYITAIQLQTAKAEKAAAEAAKATAAAAAETAKPAAEAAKAAATAAAETATTATAQAAPQPNVADLVAAVQQKKLAAEAAKA